MRLKPNKKTIILLGGLLGLQVAAFGGVLYLQSDKLAAEQKILEAKQKELDEGKNMAKRREAALAALEEDRSRLVFLESGVPDQAYVPTLLKQLEDLARLTQNRVLSVRPEIVIEPPSKVEQRRDPEAQGKEKTDEEKKPEKKPDPYTRLIIRVAMVGRFPTVQTFLDRLQRFPKIMAVEEMNLRPHPNPDPRSRESELDVDFKLTAFIMKEAPAPAPAKPAPVATAAAGGTRI